MPTKNTDMGTRRKVMVMGAESSENSHLGPWWFQNQGNSTKSKQKRQNTQASGSLTRIMFPDV